MTAMRESSASATKRASRGTGVTDGRRQAIGKALTSVRGHALRNDSGTSTRKGECCEVLVDLKQARAGWGSPPYTQNATPFAKTQGRATPAGTSGFQPDSGAGFARRIKSSAIHIIVGLVRLGFGSGARVSLEKRA
jgi:hypothetical protein